MYADKSEYIPSLSLITVISISAMLVAMTLRVKWLSSPYNSLVYCRNIKK